MNAIFLIFYYKLAHNNSIIWSFGSLKRKFFKEGFEENFKNSLNDKQIRIHAPGQNLIEVKVGESIINSIVFLSYVAVVSNPKK